MASPSDSFFDNHLSVISAHEQQEEACDSKKDAVHDPKCKASLQHGACFVDVDRERAASIKAVGAQAHVEAAIGTEVGAISIGNAAQLVDTCNECTDKAEIDEGNEEGRFAG